jgi:hypothetical protein
MSSENNIDNDYDDEQQRFLVNGTPFSSYQDLTTMIGKLKPKKTTKTNNKAKTTKDSIMKREKRQRQDHDKDQDQLTKTLTLNNNESLPSSLPLLPNEIIRDIAIYFTVKKLDTTKTRAIGCSSSSSERHELKECLIDSSSSWWISSINEGSFHNGKGEEYVEFELDTAKIVRLSTVSISIPMLPTGPLSVRTMRLDCCTASNNSNKEQQWKPITPILTVDNINGWQRIELNEPIDAQYIRLVCLSNQASSLLDNNDMTEITDTHKRALTAVGFFTVKFE